MEYLEKRAPAEDGWVCDSDSAAEWALSKIRENNAEAERLIKLCNDQIDFYTARINDIQSRARSDNAYFEMQLRRYFASVPHKATKTQETYQLASGRLKLKYPAPEISHDDEALIAAYPDFVEHVPKLRWAELKKRMNFSTGAAVDVETGEIVEGIRVVPRDPEFVVEV